MENNKLSFGLSLFILLMFLCLTIKFLVDGLFAPAFIVSLLAVGSGVFLVHDFKRLKE